MHGSKLSVNMAVCAWLLATTLLFGSVVSQSTFLGQPDFQLKFERVIVTDQDPNYFSVKTWMSKVNRTRNGINIDMNITKALGINDYAVMKGYEFLNNEYRQFAINIKMAYCDFLENVYGQYLDPEMPNQLPKKCPVQPNFYTIRNFVPNGKRFPKNLPFHKAMLQVQLFNTTNAIALAIQLYGTLDRDAIIRSRYSSK